MPSETSLYKKDGKNKKPFKVFCQITSTLQVQLPHTIVGKEQEMTGSTNVQYKCPSFPQLRTAKPQYFQSHGHIVASDPILGLVAGFDTT